MSPEDQGSDSPESSNEENHQPENAHEGAEQSGGTSVDSITSSNSPESTKPRFVSEFKPRPAKPAAKIVTDSAAGPVVTKAAPTVVSQSKGANKGSLLRTTLEVVLVLAVVGLGLWSWTLYSDRKNLESQVVSLNANPEAVVQKQNAALLTKVGKLIQLPNETPTIAEVSNAAQARQNSKFFTNAQNGDKVLLYVKTGEAILYRPSTNKIILVAPLNLNNTTSSSTTTPSTTTTKTAGH